MNTLVCWRNVRLIFFAFLFFAASLTCGAARSVAANVSQLLPSDIQVAGSIDVSWLWTNFADIRSLPSISGALTDFETSSGISIKSDLAPWVGRVVVAKLAGPEGSLRFAALVEIRNSAAFENMLFKLSTGPLGKASAALQMIVVDGHNVIELSSSEGRKIDFFVENNWLVLAYGDGAIDQLLSVSDGSRPSLASNAGMIKALAKVDASGASIWAVGDPSYFAHAQPAARPGPSSGQATGGPSSPSFWANLVGNGKFHSIDSGALIDSGNRLVIKNYYSSHNPLVVARMQQLIGGRSPVTGASLKTVPSEASIAILIASPGTVIQRELAYLTNPAPSSNGAPFRTFSLIAHQYADIYTPLTGEAALSGTYANGSFGINLAAATDSATSARSVEAAIVSLAAQAFPALHLYGSEWTTWSPGANSPSNFSPSIKTMNNYVELSTSHKWLDAPAGHFNVPFPADAVGSNETLLISFKSIDYVFDRQKSGNGAMYFSALQKDRLDTASVAAWATPDQSLTAIKTTFELNNLDWKKTLSDLIKVGVSLAPPRSMRRSPAQAPSSPVPSPVPLPPLAPPSPTPAAPALATPVTQN